MSALRNNAFHLSVGSFFAAAFVALGFLLAGCAPNRPGGADAYPAKSVTVICPWAPGGGTDRVARVLAEQLQSRFGQPFVVVNRTGGSGAVGHTAGAHAKPDGHVLTLATFELATMAQMGITPITWRDFQPVAQVNADAGAIIVRADHPWRTLSDFVASVRANPGKVQMSGTATGGAWDLARTGLLLAAGADVSAVTWVPSQGAAPALVELLGGHIEVVCCSLPEAAAQIEAGQVKVLGVMAAERVAGFPQIPTAREQGFAWEAAAWRGLMVPKGTPPAVVETLAAAVREIARSEAFARFMAKNGFTIAYKDARAFAVLLAREEQQWARIIAAAGYGRK